MNEEGEVKAKAAISAEHSASQVRISWWKHRLPSGMTSILPPGRKDDCFHWKKDNGVFPQRKQEMGEKLLYPHFSVPGMAAHYYCYVNWKMQKCQQGMKWGKSRRTEEDKAQCFSYNIFISLQWLQWVSSLNGKIGKKQACPEIRAPLIYVMKSYTR